MISHVCVKNTTDENEGMRASEADVDAEFLAVARAAVDLTTLINFNGEGAFNVRNVTGGGNQWWEEGVTI